MKLLLFQKQAQLLAERQGFFCSITVAACDVKAICFFRSAPAFKRAMSSITKLKLNCCALMLETIGAVISLETRCSILQMRDGDGIPRPPKQTGRVSRSRSRSPGAGRPKIAGNRQQPIAPSNGSKKWAEPGVVRAKYIYQPTKPCVRAA